VVGHGGGVVTDIAGFTAATLLRGVRWVAAPSTLLAMVDASVGGKTGVDLGLAKNAVGAFHQPSAVVIDAAHVTTETARAYASGLAEVVKSAVIGDPGLFNNYHPVPAAAQRNVSPHVHFFALRTTVSASPATYFGAGATRHAVPLGRPHSPVNLHVAPGDVQRRPRNRKHYPGGCISLRLDFPESP